MKPRIQRLVVFVLGAALGGGAFFWWVSRPAVNSPAETATRCVVELVRTHHPDGAALAEKEIRAALSKGVVVPGDPDSVVLAEETLCQVAAGESASGEIGMDVEKADGGLLVLAVRTVSPAAEAGLLPGSRIVSIDGKSVAGLPLAAGASHLCGEVGSDLRVAFWSPEGIFNERTLRRAPRLPGTAKADLVAPGVIQLRIEGFEAKGESALLEAVRGMLAEPKGIILDLRDCSGESVEAATEVAGLFLADGTFLATCVGPRWGPKGKALTTRGGGALSGVPLVCLVNRRTARAAEILAGGLRASGRAKLVGERTYGKLTVQDRFPFPGGLLILTVGRYLFPGEESTPDALLPDLAMKEKTDEGAWLAAARQLLEKNEK